MNDLATATKLFWDQVASYRPSQYGGMRQVLKELVDWTNRHPELRFVFEHHGRDSKRVVKFCLDGMPVSFWAAWPREGDGARLTLLASGHPTYPEELREYARQELIRITGRRIGSTPQIPLRDLIDPIRRQRLKELLTQLFCRLTGRTVGSASKPPLGREVWMPSRPKFQAELDSRLDGANNLGWTFIDIDAALLHFAISCPACAESLAICCEVMREAMLPGDRWAESPMGWVGRPVATVRYLLPRRPHVPALLPEPSPEATPSPTSEHQPPGIATRTQVPHETAGPTFPEGVRIGHSVEEPPGRIEITISRIVRDSEQAARVKGMHAHRCQVCGERLKLKGGYYSEAHHVKPLGRGGLDVAANIMCVCPNHHALLDHGAIPLDPKDLRKADHHEVAQENISFHNREIYHG